MKKYLKYLVFLVLFVSAGIAAGKNSSSERNIPVGTAAINLKVEKKTSDAQFRSDFSYTDDGYDLKKRSHKRRRKVRPPKEGKPGTK